MRNMRNTAGILLLIIMLGLSGCSLFADPDRDLLMKINEKGYTQEQCLILEEACLSAAAELFSEGCWETSIQGMDFADYMKNMVQDNVMNIFVFAAMAEEEGVTLTADEEVSAGYVAEHYMNTLDHRCSGTEQEQITQAANTYCLARKYEDSISNLARTEVPEEDARVIHGRQIVCRFTNDEERSEAKKRIVQVMELLAGGKGFNQLDSVTTDAEEIEITLAKNEAEDWQLPFFSVQEDQVSELVEREGCYILFQMRESDVRKQTVANRARMQEKAAQELIQSTYAKYASSHNVTWNYSLWENVDIRTVAEEAGDTSLFTMYQEVFQ